MASIVELRIHGTVEMYKRGECRCSECTAAFMRYVPHGTISGYTHHGCRCDECREARNAHCRTSTRESSRSVDPLSEALIVKAVEQHLAKHNELPSRSSTDTTGLGGRSWATAESWLRRHSGKTIRTLMGEQARPRFTDDFEWSEETIRSGAMEFMSRTGAWPTTKSGACPAFGGRTWEAAAGWLRKRGLTLAGLRQAELPDTPHLTVIEVSELVGVPRQAVQELCRTGLGPTFFVASTKTATNAKVFTRSEVNRWIEEDLGSMAVQEVLKDFFQMVGRTQIARARSEYDHCATTHAS